VTVAEPPSAIVDPLTVTLEFVRSLLPSVATDDRTPAELVFTTPAVVSGVVTVPVNVGDALGALAARSVVRLVTCDSAIVFTLTVGFAAVPATVIVESAALIACTTPGAPGVPCGPGAETVKL
jgi:hypothetical protein